MNAHTDTYADRGCRDPRPLTGATANDQADAWNRAALNHDHFGDPAKAVECRTLAALAVMP